MGTDSSEGCLPAASPGLPIIEAVSDVHFALHKIALAEPVIFNISSTPSAIVIFNPYMFDIDNVACLDDLVLAIYVFTNEHWCSVSELKQ